MDTATIAGSTANSTGTSSGSNSAVSKDEFLRLFTTQLKAQNPLKPMESTEFTSQLAQFSSLEQLTNMSSALNDLLLYQNSLQNTLTSGLIGKQVRVSGSETYLKDDASISFSLPQDAVKVNVTITDQSGKTVRVIEMGAQKAGDKTYTWDGRDATGKKLTEGNYKVKVDALDSSGNTVKAETSIYGTVKGITYDNNKTYIILDNGMKVQLSDIKEIRGGGA